MLLSLLAFALPSAAVWAVLAVSRRQFERSARLLVAETVESLSKTCPDPTCSCRWDIVDAYLRSRKLMAITVSDVLGLAGRAGLAARWDEATNTLMAADRGEAIQGQSDRDRQARNN